jgi:hypothetical protein
MTLSFLQTSAKRIFFNFFYASLGSSVRQDHTQDNDDKHQYNTVYSFANVYDRCFSGVHTMLFFDDVKVVWFDGPAFYNTGVNLHWCAYRGGFSDEGVLKTQMKKRRVANGC